MTTRNRRLLWAASVIIAFVLGYLLGRRQGCPSMSLGDGSVAGNSAGSPPGGPSRNRVTGKNRRRRQDGRNERRERSNQIGRRS